MALMISFANTIILLHTS